MKRYACAVTVACAVSGVAAAQSYPTRPIRLIVPYAAGGSTDLVARVIGLRLNEALGQTVIIENRTGAGGNIGTDIAAKAAPDGYTLLMATVTNAINVSLYASLPFNFERDFVPVSQGCLFALVLSVHPSLPVRTPAEFAALARAKPKQLTYATAGIGTSSHLTSEMFSMMAGVKMVHVPYKGTAPLSIDLMAGQVTSSFLNTITAMPHLKSGKLRGLGVSSAERFAMLPDLPTISESVFKGFEAVGWNGLVAPAGTPREIVARLNAEISRTLALPEVKERLTAAGGIPGGGSVESFAAFLKADIARWAEVIKASGAKPE